MLEEDKKYPLETLRTYKGDVSSYLEGKKISWEDLIKKKKEKGAGRYALISKKKIVFILGFLTVISVSVFLFLAFLKSDKTKEEQPVFRPPKALIQSDESVGIIVSDKKSFFADWQNLKKKTLEPEKNRTVYLVKKNGEEKIVLNSKEVFKFLEIPTPLSFLGSLNGEITLGLVGTLKENEPLFLLGVNNYDRAFSVMLKWESSLLRDFRFFSEEESLKDTEFQFFSDEIIKNQNARVLRDKNKEPIILYTFFNKKILIIGFSRETLEASLKRLE